MLSILLGIIWFAGVLYWDVIDDYIKWKQNIALNHTKEAIIRGLLLLPTIVALSVNEFDFFKLVIVLLMVFLWWLFLFDGIYNHIRGFNWWFLGSVDDNDALTDKLQRKIPLSILKVSKILLPLIFTTVYILW